MKEDFTLENFLKAVKIDKDHVLYKFIVDIFTVINKNKHNIDEYQNLLDKESNSLDKILDCYCSNEKSFNIVSKLIQEKRIVYVGEFHGYLADPTESYLCEGEILFSNNDIYFESLKGSYY
ncbi:MAG: hypothetical protein LBJ61_11855 [Deltaproteobacteria bacterium]|jgi:hypothetical protein|nr:hypothetical protein [Deltaproteobacteria bacterium]